MSGVVEDVEETAQHQKLSEWMQGDVAAVAMIERLFDISQIADDFVDDDKPMNKSACMTELLNLALIEVPANPFYRANQGLIAPILMAVVAAFNTSNALQKSANRDCAMMGWALRDSLEHLITVCAYIKYGGNYAAKVALDVAIYFRTNEDKETLDNWVNS